MTIRERIRAKAWSLAGELVLWLLISGIGAGAVSGVFNMAVTRKIDDYFLETSYLQKEELKMVQELQDYVLAQGIAASDQGALSEWVKKKSIVYLEIYRNDMLLYVSDTTEAEDYYEDMEVPYYRESYYDVTFADGKAEVFLTGAFAYRYQMYAMVASVVLCFLIFIGCFLWGVPVRGWDELARLAGGLNQMRQALKENMEREQELREANRDLIVGLAHDLRTPLTALTTYVQVMQSGVCGDEAKRDYYLDKIMAKAVQMKELSDRLFECSQVGEEKGREKAGEPMIFQSVFIDSLSEMAMFLEGQGFEVEACLEWKREMIRVRMDYISRIVDNLGMNLVKYADSDETVRISTVYDPGWAGIEVCNRIKRQGEPVVSTKIGMGNVRAMMGDMWGRCEEEVGEGRYRIRVLFPVEGI